MKPIGDTHPVTRPDDPRLSRRSNGEVAGDDQIDGMLKLTPDGRLDSLVAMVAFGEELRRGRIVRPSR